MRFLSFIPVLVVTATLVAMNTFHVHKSDIITKKEWGGKPMTKKMETQEITHITIHHGGVEFPEGKDPIKYMQNLQKFSQEDKGWADIPYHFCIDLNGKIYEARPLEYPGDTNTEYDPTGHALINVMGNYEIQTIKPVQLEAITHLSAWLAQEYEVPTDSIATHKDYSDQTVCPGKDLYKYFQNGTIAHTVDSLLHRNQ
jgi:hypothetical protein